MSAPLHIGLLSVSDRASDGTYQDAGIPALQAWLQHALASPWQPHARLVPDSFDEICAALKALVDDENCGLVLTTGGTGPAPRDVTPEATLAIAHRVMPGFGEQMRQVNLRYVPTAILSRQTAVIRARALIVNLPGQPKAIGETLDGIFAAVPYCLELIGAARLDTHDSVIPAYRPKSAGKR